MAESVAGVRAGGAGHGLTCRAEGTRWARFYSAPFSSASARIARDVKPSWSRPV